MGKSEVNDVALGVVNVVEHMRHIAAVPALAACLADPGS